MTTPVPFGVFAQEMLPGETIEWSGRPNPAVILHKEDWFMIPFSLLWGGFDLLAFGGIGDLGHLEQSTYSNISVVWNHLGNALRCHRSIHDLGPFHLCMVEERQNLLCDHKSSGSNRPGRMGESYSIERLFRKHFSD